MFEKEREERIVLEKYFHVVQKNSWQTWATVFYDFIEAFTRNFHKRKTQENLGKEGELQMLFIFPDSDS